MNKIDDYIPTWLRTRVKGSVARAIGFEEYQWEWNYWLQRSQLGLFYFQYCYYKEVMFKYIEADPNMEQESNNQWFMFNSKEV